MCQSPRKSFKQLALFSLIAFTLTFIGYSPANAQTFRGGINGTVTDHTGAAIANATVVAVQTETGSTHTTISSSSGDFLFQDLPLGAYSVTASFAGFQTVKTDKITVSAGSTYTLSIKLPLSSSSTTIEVDAAGVALDTTSVTQTTNIESKVVNDTPMNGRDFTQLISIAPGFGGYSAGGFGSVNGTRANQVNWQIDGVDNNDLWHNVPAVNQGGVYGIAGIVLPLDSIDQFSQQTQSTAEAGRNPGGVVNVVTKSGTNSIHGSLYYFNRNELFSANSPFSSLPKGKLRNQQYGVSFGGPVIKDKLFYFFNYEKQQFIISSPSPQTTEPTTAFQTDAKALLSQYGLSPTSVATASLATFWPSDVLNCPTVNSSCDSANNYQTVAPITGYSYNGVGKVDFKINSKHDLALRMYGGQGNQIAPVGTVIPYYFEAGPIHVYNWSAVVNSVLTSRFTNQVLLGVNYFNQVFFDANHSFNPIALGFNTGAAQPLLSGVPGIKITGFDNLQNATPPSGRNDVTGQVTDTASLVLGKHQLRFSGEFRRGFVNEFYHRKTRGNFSFPGTQGPWGYTADGGFNSAPCQDAYKYTTPTAAQQAYVAALNNKANGKLVQALADFMLGCTQQAQIVRGNTEREVYVNNFSGSVSDAFQLTPKLNVNFGLRYDYLGPMHNGTQDLSVFRPDNPNAVHGLVFQGKDIDSLFPKTTYDFSPRLGLAYQPSTVSGLVVRTGFGMFFDQPNLNPFLDNRPPNGGASGAESNPGGPSPVSSLSRANIVITPGKLLFPTTTAYDSATNYNLFSISPNLRPAYTFNYNLNVEKTLGSQSIFTLGYVGSQSRKLISNIDINPAPLGSSSIGTTAQNAKRPYGTRFSNYGTINQVSSIGNSNYSSLQTTFKTTGWHSVTSQFSYTWAHGLDILTQYRNANITNPLNPRADYGNMDYDTRHAFVSYLTYDVPGSSFLRPLSTGWQLNSLITFHSGQPYTLYTGNDTSGTGEGEDRVNQVGSAYAGSSKKIVNYQVQWLTPTDANGVNKGFIESTTPSFGTMRRNQLNAPGYGDVDLSVFKNNKFEVLGHNITTQFRVEMFNLFNRVNLAPPDNYLADGTGFGTITQTIGYYNGAPGIGPGEPFNTQLALKILF